MPPQAAYPYYRFQSAGNVAVMPPSLTMWAQRWIFGIAALYTGLEIALPQSTTRKQQPLPRIRNGIMLTVHRTSVNGQIEDEQTDHAGRCTCH